MIPMSQLPHIAATALIQIVNRGGIPGIVGKTAPDVDLEDFIYGDLYVRKLGIKAGEFIIGKQHSQKSLFFVTKGKMAVQSIGNPEIKILEAGAFGISEPYAQRLVRGLEDGYFINVWNLADARNAPEIESELLK